MIHIDLIIIYLFLGLTFVLGVYYSRGIQTFQDYAIGNKKLSAMVIAVSLIATCHGGKALSNTLDQFCRQGFYALIAYFNSPIAYYIAYRFIVVRMKEFAGHYSVAESMGSIYGSTVRVFTAILSIVASLATLALQIRVGLDITIKLFPESAHWSTGLAIVLVIGYATFGGARAVALTDVYQFLFFFLYCPMLMFVLLYHNENLLGGWKSLTAIPQFHLNKVLTWDDTLKSALESCFWGTITALGFQPEYVQRFYMASSIPKGIKAVKISTVIRILLTVLFVIIAMGLRIGGPGMQPKQKALDYIVQLNYFPGMQGLLVTAIFALLMSTADSSLHAASVFIANDIWPVMQGLKKRTVAITPSLKVVRWTSCIIGIISFLIAFQMNNVVSLLQKSYLPYKLAVGIPFIMTCLGFRPRPLTVFLTMGSSVALVLYHIYYKGPVLSPTKAGMVFVSSTSIHLWGLSLAILLAVHYLLPKRPGTGWVGIPDSSLWDLQNQMTKRWWKERLQQLMLLFTKTYQEAVFPKERKTFILFGVYVMISTFIALCFIHKAYLFPYIYWYVVVMVIATAIAVYPAFHSYQKGGNRLLHGAWPGLLFILLFIASLQFVKLGYGRPMVCALFITTLWLAIVLLSLEVSMVMLGIAVLMHGYIPPYLPLWKACWASFSTLSIELCFAMILITTAVVGLSTYKYLRGKLGAKFKVMELTRAYEHRITLEAIYHQANWSRLDMTYGNQLLQQMNKKLKDPETLEKTMPLLMHKLQQFHNFLLKRAKAEPSLELNQNTVKTVPFEPVILKAYQAIRALGEPIQLLLRKQTNVKQLLVDPELFECFLMLNLWGISKSEQISDHLIALMIADTTLHYDAALTLPALAFCMCTDMNMPNLLPTYTIIDKSKSVYAPKIEKQFYQIESRQIIEAHGGYVDIVDTGAVLTYLYVLPIAGQKVMRFKTYDPIYLTNPIVETPESLVQEKELITLLPSATTLRKETVMRTISFIKNAHGLVKRKSGAPYYTHPMAVAKILLTLTKDPDTILAGLLHDVIEDTPITLEQIKIMYGATIASIVEHVTHYNTNGYRWKLEEKEKKHLLDQCNDIRVVQVKLADRLHNIQTLDARKKLDQKRIAQDTLTFYIPWGRKYKIPESWLVEMTQLCEAILSQKNS